MLNIDGALGADQSDIQEKPRLYVTLQKSDKQICRTKPVGHHFIRQTSIWQITKFHSIGVYKESNFPQFQLFPQPENQYQSDEWPVLMGFLHKYEKVALVSLEGYELYIQAPDAEFSHAIVMYQILSPHYIPNFPFHTPACGKEVIGPQEVTGDKAAFFIREVDASPPLSFGEATNNLRSQSLKKNFLSNHPTILKALSHTHGWIFGAIAELVDNSRDANSKRLDINIESFYSKKEGKTIPVLSVIDDGHGMSHDKIMTMIAFGHSLPEGRLSGSIGRFGIGFKTGSMRLGKDAIVLTQTSTSRSVALLSQTFNEDKPNLEVPVVSYCKHNNYMELDLSVQSEASAEYTLKAIKNFSPFNEYFLGQKLGLFGETGTGTQIYIWNLDKWGQNYSLEWDNNMHEGDILIRSKRVRSRRGQLNQQVPLDYSLRAYMEVIFLNPRMQTYIQGSLVKAYPLTKSLNQTARVKGMIMGKPLHLTIGRSNTEWERGNCGIFLYWQDRLIEAYKRVGGQVYNPNMGRGIIGVMDTTNFMDDDDGKPWVMNNKQQFLDCEASAKLEEWLGQKYDEYWEKNFDPCDLKKGSDRYKPDHSVQCDKCGTWRVLDSAFNTDTSLGRRCEDPHRQVAHGVITVSAKGSGYGEENTTTEDPVSSRAGPSKRKKVKAAQRLLPQSSSSATAETDAGILNISTGEEDSGGNNDNIEEKIRASTLASLRRLRGCK
ncbi:hypothetical protein LUZ61_019759 [Rhynchospora tenuis]|uniref:Morc S5 domain-containing protein n=1 Tax=Rhynchospora tenuis TaxID=198213 RepID=A0AAD5ZBQ8_9POAL|nr:hypothetical protein LUZ61_019759 [Rhynchospora tenuis]